MSFTINKIKKPLQTKTAKRRKDLEQGVAQSAIAATTDSILLPQLECKHCKIAELKGLTRRARKTEPAQLTRVMNSIREFGQTVPVLIDKNNRIIHGHIVVEALRKLGAKEVFCVQIDHLNERQQELLHVALNRTAESGEWHIEDLGSLLVDLEANGLAIEISGFSAQEIDILTTSVDIGEEAETAGGDPADECPEPPVTPVSILGDFWRLGDHLLLCGDATKPESYTLVLGKVKAAAIFTDSPWNLKIDGFVSGLGKVKHADFKMAAGEMSVEQFQTFVRAFTELCAEHLAEGGAFFSCIDHRSVDLIIAEAKLAGLKHINMAVWNKGSGGMGSYLRSAHELIPIFVKGDKLAVNNVELGKHGRDRTNVWSYPGANRKGSSAGKALKHHPTPKPIELVRDALLDVTKRGAIVLDPFIGSGTTILAADRATRKARGIELDPAYVDVAIRRWQEMTGKEAVHAETGLTFSQMADERALDEAA